MTLSHAKAQQSIPEDARLELIDEQKMIVSALSGRSKIEEERYLKRRWTEKEKKLARGFLFSRLLAIGIHAREHNYEVSLPHKSSSQNPFRGTNLFAILPATIETTEFVIIGAHYDTVRESPGAMDNATGCGLVYGVAELITRIPGRRRNVIIAFFDQEETGHAGSYAFANYIKDKAFDVHSVHTFDMIGWDNDEDRNIELELPTPELESVYRKHAESYGIVAYRTQTTETDHREFRNAGFNAIGIGGEHKNGDESPHHHLPTDTFETVNFEYLAFVSILVYSVIKDLISE
jgi:hypothetical protein